MNIFSWFRKKPKEDRPILAYVAIDGPLGNTMMPVYDMYTGGDRVFWIVKITRIATITGVRVYSPQMICLSKQPMDSLHVCSGDVVHVGVVLSGEAK